MDDQMTLYIIIPLFTAFLIPLIGRVGKGIPRTMAWIAFMLLTTLALSAIFNWDREMMVMAIGGWGLVESIPVGIFMIFDGLTATVLGIINFIALLSAIYAGAYMKKYTDEIHFYSLLCLMVAGMNGVVLSGDLFNLYVFLEIAAIASYALVAFGVDKEELEASFKYQVLGGLASMLILLGIGLIYWTTGTLNIADISRMLATVEARELVLFIQVLMIVGFGLKAAIAPFHAWLPDAHSSAPSPISSMLSGVLIKAIGLYVLIRLFFHLFAISYEIALILTALGVLSMIVGGIMAIGQWDYKRLLAYSSISQVGYIVTGFGVALLVLAKNGDPAIAGLALFGGLYHLVNHAVFKSLMFMTAGSVEYATGSRDLRQLGGLGKLMPVTSSSALSGAMAISGLPPFSGFFSKLVIIVATIQAGYYLVAFIAAAMSIITLGYFIKLQKEAFAGQQQMDFSDMKAVPGLMKLPMVTLAVLCVLLSLMIFPAIREVLLTPAVESLLAPQHYATAVLGP